MTENPSKSTHCVALFLEFLARDIANFPERITALDPDQAKHVHRLVKGVISGREASLGEEDLLSRETSDSL